MTTERFTSAQTDTAVSAVDLTGKEFFAAKRTPTGLALCGAGERCDGVISEGKAAGLHSSIKTGNQVKGVAGGAISVGDLLTPNASGKFVEAGAGDEVFGIARSAAGAADDLVSIDVDRSSIP